MQETKSVVGIDPIALPVFVVDGVLPNVVASRFKSWIVGRELGEIEDALEETHIVKPAVPSDVFDLKPVDDVATRLPSDRHVGASAASSKSSRSEIKRRIRV